MGQIIDLSKLLHNFSFETNVGTVINTVNGGFIKKLQ